MTSKPRKRRRKFAFHRQTKPGAAPGSVVVSPQFQTPVMRVMAVGPAGCREVTVKSVEELKPFLADSPVVWIDVEGLGDAELIVKLGELLGLHKLALEDVVNIHQRAKIETYDNRLFIVARMISQCEPLETEQLSIFLGEKFVLTFQEQRPGDPFEAVRERLRRGNGKLREMGAGHLAYALLDAVVDAYFPLLESYGERLDAVEADIFSARPETTIATIHAIKSDLLLMRRAIWPLRDAVNTLIRDHTDRFGEGIEIYLRDLYDHTFQIIDLIDTGRELSSDLMDVYFSMISNRMNEVMRVLTVIATIFIPLTFVVGIYGMNFNTEVSPYNMPELKWYYGYPFAWAMMGLVTAAMVYFFYRKGWLRSLSPSPDMHQVPPTVHHHPFDDVRRHDPPAGPPRA